MKYICSFCTLAVTLFIFGSLMEAGNATDVPAGPKSDLGLSLFNGKRNTGNQISTTVSSPFAAIHKTSSLSYANIYGGLSDLKLTDRNFQFTWNNYQAFAHIPKESSPPLLLAFGSALLLIVRLRSAH